MRAQEYRGAAQDYTRKLRKTHQDGRSAEEDKAVGMTLEQYGTVGHWSGRGRTGGGGVMAPVGDGRAGLVGAGSHGLVNRVVARVW